MVPNLEFCGAKLPESAYTCLVAAIPPYNSHLAVDAGAGLLAAGVISTYAFFVPKRQVLLTAMAGVLAFSVPHAGFHLLNPAESYRTTLGHTLHH